MHRLFWQHAVLHYGPIGSKQEWELWGIVILSGRNITCDQNSPKILLFGNCAIKRNKHLDKAVKVEGCPPDMQACLKEMVGHMRGVHRRIESCKV